MTWKTETCATCEYNVDGRCRALPCRDTWCMSIGDSEVTRVAPNETVRHVNVMRDGVVLDFFQYTRWPVVHDDTDACGMWKERWS